MITLPGRPNILKHFNTNIYDDIGAIAGVWGTPSISSAKQRFTGKNSIYVSTNNSVQFANDDSFNFGNGDFTISWSEYLTSALPNGCSFIASSSNLSSGYSGIMFGYNSGANRYLYVGSTGASWDIANAVSLGTIASCLNVWVDWELARQGNNFYVFKNGILIATFSSDLAIYYNANYFTAYGIYFAIQWLGNAYMCEFMVLKGTNLHTATFTPNTEEYTIPTTNFNGIVLTNRDIGVRTDNHQGYYIKTLSQSGSRSILNQQGNYIYCFEKPGVRQQMVWVGSLSNCFENYGIKPQNIRQGTSANKGIDVSKIAVEKSCFIIKPKNVWRLKQPLQVSKSKLQDSGAMTKLSLIGDTFKAENMGKLVVFKPTTIHKFNGIGIRQKNLIGCDARTFQVESSARSKFNITVTPTHQYKTQIISVQASSKVPQQGKWKFLIGGITVLPYTDSPDLANITFTIDTTLLAFGVNKCKLYFNYSDGSTEFIPLEITREQMKRVTVERTFKDYDGGYELTNVTKGNLVNGYIGAKLIDDSTNNPTSGTIKTIDGITSVDLNNYLGIVGISAECSNCKLLFSFDGSSGPWYGANMAQVDPANIATQGIDGAQLSSITSTQWAQIFKPTVLNVMAYLYKLDPITDINAGYGDVLGKESGSWKWYQTKTYRPPTGYTIKSVTYDCYASNYGTDAWAYGKIIVKDNKGNTIFTDIAQEWKTLDLVATHKTGSYFGGGTYIDSVYTEIQAQRDLSSGVTATVTLESLTYLKSLVFTLSSNVAPEIKNISLSPSTVHKETTILSGLITDLENDKVQYKVTVNGNTTIVPWTSFLQTPITLNIPIPYNVETVGTNLIEIEAYDGDKTTIYDTYITQTNNNPCIAGVLKGLYLNATAGDADNDTIKYRILFNGIVKADWTDFMPSAVSLSYKINRKDVKIGQQNSLVVEVMDDLGGIGSCTFDFVGVDNKKRYAFIT